MKGVFFRRVIALAWAWTVYAFMDIARHLSLLIENHFACTVYASDPSAAPLAVALLPLVVDYLRSFIYYLTMTLCATTAVFMLRHVLAFKAGTISDDVSARFILSSSETVICVASASAFIVIHVITSAMASIAYQLFHVSALSQVITILGFLARLGMADVITVITVVAFGWLILFFTQNRSTFPAITALLLLVFFLPLSVQAVALIFDTVLYFGFLILFIFTSGAYSLAVFHKFENVSFNIVDSLLLGHVSVICIAHAIAIIVLRIQHQRRIRSYERF